MTSLEFPVLLPAPTLAELPRDLFLGCAGWRAVRLRGLCRGCTTGQKIVFPPTFCNPEVLSHHDVWRLISETFKNLGNRAFFVHFC